MLLSPTVTRGNGVGRQAIVHIVCIMGRSTSVHTVIHARMRRHTHLAWGHLIVRLSSLTIVVHTVSTHSTRLVSAGLSLWRSTPCGVGHISRRVRRLPTHIRVRTPLLLGIPTILSSHLIRTTSLTTIHHGTRLATIITARLLTPMLLRHMLRILSKGRPLWRLTRHLRICVLRRLLRRRWSLLTRRRIRGTLLILLRGMLLLGGGHHCSMCRRLGALGWARRGGC